MILPERFMVRVPTPVARGLAALGFLAVFFTAASLFRPAATRATVTTLDPGPAEPRATQHLRGVKMPALIGTLVNTAYTIDVYITRSGPRYTVKDTAGRTLADMLASEDLYRQFPDLDVDHLHADSVGQADVELDN